MEISLARQRQMMSHFRAYLKRRARKKGRKKGRKRGEMAKIRFILIDQNANLIGRINKSFLIDRFPRNLEIQDNHLDHLRGLARIADFSRLAIQARRDPFLQEE